jgi:cytochrome c oxidase subunit 2
VEVGLRYLKGPGEGIQFLSTLDPAQRQMSDAGHPSGDYLLKVDHRWWCRWAEGAHHHHRQRRDPLLDDPGLRRQAGRDPRLRADTWFRADRTGDFYGQCAELCGKEHAYMPIHVRVLSADDYAQWVAGEKKRMADAADDPKKVWTLDA